MSSARQAPPRGKKQLLIDAAHRRAKSLHAQRRFGEALQACLQATRLHPTLAPAWIDAAVNCIRLERWQDAIRYGERAKACGGEGFALHDALSHAHGALRQWAEVRHHGLRALTLRDQRFGGAVPVPHALPRDLPPPPCARTRDHNIISFSLFGGDSKYCETAVINALEQPAIYSHWCCRFYVDESVPTSVHDRLLGAGAQVRMVDADLKKWPGPMWRFAALSEPGVHRVLFRDADSVISAREAEAVSEWLASGRRFHAMRDCGTHTELLLAGLWGAVAGSLPMEELLRLFFRTTVDSQHFADQFFLRQFVWPYARQSLLQHDSMFGFLDARPFPGGPMPPDFHVGYSEGSPFFRASSALRDGTRVIWRLRFMGLHEDTTVCTYPAIVLGGEVRAHLPARYAKWLDEGCANIDIVET